MQCSTNNIPTGVCNSPTLAQTNRRFRSNKKKKKTRHNRWCQPKQTSTFFVTAVVRTCAQEESNTRSFVRAVSLTQETVNIKVPPPSYQTAIVPLGEERRNEGRPIYGCRLSHPLTNNTHQHIVPTTACLRYVCNYCCNPPPPHRGPHLPVRTTVKHLRRPKLRFVQRGNDPAVTNGAGHAEVGELQAGAHVAAHPCCCFRVGGSGAVFSLGRIQQDAAWLQVPMHLPTAATPFAGGHDAQQFVRTSYVRV